MEQVFRIWPTLAEMAADLGRPYPTVAAWKQRGSIPGRYDLELIAAAKARGKSLTLEDLAVARATRSESGTAA